MGGGSVQIIMTPEEQQKLNDLMSRVNQLESFQHNFQTTPLINRYLDNQSKDILGQIVGDQILQIVWDDYFYYHTFFESLSGFQLAATGGSITIGGSGAALNTGATNTNFAAANKEPQYQTILRWDREQRFRSGFATTSVTQVFVSVVVGNYFHLAGEPYYGFQITNGVVSGVAYNGGSVSSVNLNTTVAANENHTYEARFFPGNRVDFYIDEVIKGTVTTNLPTGGVHTIFYEFGLKTTENVAKTLHISTFEYIQNTLAQ